MGRSSQFLMCSRIAAWVSSKQRSGAFDRPESYPAPPTQGSLLSSSAMDFFCTNIRLHHARRQNRHLRIVESFGGHLQNPVKGISLSMLEKSTHRRSSPTLNTRNASLISFANPCSSFASWSASNDRIKRPRFGLFSQFSAASFILLEINSQIT